MKTCRVEIAAIKIVGFLFIASHAWAADLPMDCGEEPTDAIVEYGQATSCSFGSAGDIDIFRFAAEAQEIPIIRATRTSGTGGDVCIDLYGPDNVLITSQCAFSVTLEPSPTQVGTHTLRLQSSTASQHFDYILLLERLSPPSPTSIPVKYGDLVNGVFDFRGDVDLFLFQASAGDSPIIRATRTSGTGGAACIGLFGPDFTLIESACGNPVTIEPTLTQDGTHTLRLESSNPVETFS